MNKGNYIFFWLEGDILSQWYPSVFKDDKQVYSCAEQYMMFKKAEHFKDFKTASKIMKATHPKEMKNLGRTVLNYDNTSWLSVDYDIVKQGNFYKFSQNPELKEYLISTEHKILVEASPYDRKWGIGMSVNDPLIKDESKWKGENKLGRVLMEVRERLIEESK